MHLLARANTKKRHIFFFPHPFYRLSAEGVTHIKGGSSQRHKGPPFQIIYLKKIKIHLQVCPSIQVLVNPRYSKVDNQE